MTGSLYSYRQGTLMLGASTGSTTGLNLPSIRYEASQFRWIFIVYGINTTRAKGAKLTPRHISWSIPCSSLGFPES